MPLFGKSPKAPADIVKSLRDAVTLLEKGDGKKSDKIQEDIGKGLSAMKSVLIGGADGEPSTEHVAQLAQEAYSQHLLPLLVTNLHRFDFEGKKEVASIFNNILRRQIGTRSPTVEYLSNRSEIIIHLIKGYENAEVALNCGSMLRECVRHETLARIVLYSTEFYDFFKYVEDYNFDIATDAFSTFKEVLIKHKSLSAEFLEKNYDTFYEAYLKLLNSENYVTKRQSLKLLGELLLDRHNFTVMTRYISNHCLMFQLLGELLLDRHNFTVMTRYISNHCLMFQLLGELLLDRHNFTVMTRYISTHCLMFQLLGELLLDRHNFTVMTRYISNHCLMFQLLGELLLDRHNFTVMTRYISTHCLMFQLLGELLLDRHNFTVMTRYISNHCLMFQLLGELLLDRHNFTVMTRYISTHCLMFQLLGELLLDRHNFTVMTRYISNHCLMFQLLGELLLDRHNFTVMTRYISTHCLMFQLLGELLLDRHNFTVMTRYISNHCLMFQLLGELLLDRHNFTVMTRYISNHCLMFQLLGELLLDRHNFTVMTRYISNPENLKLMMNLLKCKSRSIQFEAFHVFKIFVANPNKPKPILDILIRNREKLVEFLTKFQTERTEDEQFNDEKVYLIKQIQEMKAAA